MILVLSRGHVCPKDHQQHVQLAAFYPQLVAGYTQIVTIATDNIIIQEYTGPHDDPMIPHTLVQMPGLVIHSVYNGYRYWSRRSIDDLYRDLPEVTREIRPDWDLSEPGLRENWEKGDRSLHYSYKEADLARGPGKPIREPEAGSHGAGCRAGRRTPSSGESGGVSGGVGGSVAPQEGVTVRVGASGSPLQMSGGRGFHVPPEFVAWWSKTSTIGNRYGRAGRPPRPRPGSGQGCAATSRTTGGSCVPLAVVRLMRTE